MRKRLRIANQPIVMSTISKAKILWRKRGVEGAISWEKILKAKRLALGLRALQKNPVLNDFICLEGRREGAVTERGTF